MLDDPDGFELDDATDDEDPAGGVQLPPGRGELARAYALAGLALGVSAVAGLAGGWPPSSITSITI